jgi:hypothetical protein
LKIRATGFGGQSFAKSKTRNRRFFSPGEKVRMREEVHQSFKVMLSFLDFPASELESEWCEF